MDRRAFLSAAPVALVPIAAHAAPSPSIAALVEAAMCAVIPVGSTYVAVRASDMQALCEATGVIWGEHWATRLRNL